MFALNGNPASHVALHMDPHFTRVFYFPLCDISVNALRMKVRKKIKKIKSYLQKAMNHLTGIISSIHMIMQCAHEKLGNMRRESRR